MPTRVLHTPSLSTDRLTGRPCGLPSTRPVENPRAGDDCYENGRDRAKAAPFDADQPGDSRLPPALFHAERTSRDGPQAVNNKDPKTRERRKPQRTRRPRRGRRKRSAGRGHARGGCLEHGRRGGRQHRTRGRPSAWPARSPSTVRRVLLAGRPVEPDSRWSSTSDGPGGCPALLRGRFSSGEEHGDGGGAGTRSPLSQVTRHVDRTHQGWDRQVRERQFHEGSSGCGYLRHDQHCSCSGGFFQRWGRAFPLRDPGRSDWPTPRRHSAFREAEATRPTPATVRAGCEAMRNRRICILSVWTSSFPCMPFAGQPIHLTAETSGQQDEAREPEPPTAHSSNGFAGEPGNLGENRGRRRRRPNVQHPVEGPARRTGQRKGASPTLYPHYSFWTTPARARLPMR